MLVKMRKGITGRRNGKLWPPVGGTIEVPDSEGALLVAAGHAVEVDDSGDEVAEGGSDDGEPTDPEPADGSDASPADTDAAPADGSDASPADAADPADSTEPLTAPARNARVGEWRAYATQLGIESVDRDGEQVPVADASRDEIVTAVDARTAAT